MKKLFKILGIMSFALTVGCAQEDMFDSAMSQSGIPDGDVISGDIKKDALMNYIKINHPQSASRGLSDGLQPIIYMGDTICYFVNFDNGWELYSNSLTMPILLMKSETGQFNFDGNDDNPALASLMEAAKAALYHEKNDDFAVSQESSDEWSLYFANTEDDKETVSNTKSIYRKPVPKRKYAVGRYTYSGITDSITHLIKTKWHQSYPYNEYCPFVNDTNIHSAAGCVPVAVAQFLYYTRYQWGIPEECVTTATYDNSTNTYNFSGSSSSIWDAMPLNSYIDSTPALLIGHAGKEMKTSYGTEDTNQGSSTYTSNLISFVKSYANIDLYLGDFESEEVYDCLSRKNPVLGNIFVSDENKGHTLIFDHCRRVSRVTEHYYAELSEDPGYGPMNPVPFMGYHEAVAQYGDVEVVTTTSSSYYFKANWGWGPYENDPEINGELLRVINAGYTFDKMYMMTYSIYK